jgi:hypothetical protein
MTGNQAVSAMFSIKSSIHMGIIVLLEDRDEDHGLSIHLHIHFTQVVMEIIRLIYMF